MATAVRRPKETVLKEQQAEHQQLLMQTLAEIGGQLTAEEEVVWRGKEFVLPAGLSMSDAIDFLKNKLDEDERPMGFQRTFRFRPWDGARATLQALKRAFGMVQQKGVPSFFGTTPPRLIQIPVSHDENGEVPWGGLAVPLMPGAVLYVGEMEDAEMGKLFHVHAEAPRKWRHHIEGIFNLIQEELEQNSLYRGKSFDGQEKPQFLDLRGVSPDKVIYTAEVERQLEANLWGLLRHTTAMRDHGVPLKRAVLLEGPYGCGKTLGAYLTAKIAQENDWTFILCRPGRDDLRQTIATARLYQPCVVFFEDVDTVAGSAGNGESGKDHVAGLLDIFDGIQSKGTEIICVLTTNHAEHIHKGMLRPGRLDSIISVRGLDQDGIERMAKASIPNRLLASTIDWTKVGVAMDGFLPSFVREALDRTVRYNIARNKGAATQLDTDDFVASAHGLRPQLKLMEEALETGTPPSLDSAFEAIARRSARDTLNETRVLDNDGDDFGTLVGADEQR